MNNTVEELKEIQDELDRMMDELWGRLYAVWWSIQEERAKIAMS